jgi:16S rRNA (guanine1516-N2)-methyltransferase
VRPQPTDIGPHWENGEESDPVAADPKLVIDFVGGSLGYRFRRGFSRNDGLAKAAGFKGKTIPAVIDATAGLGRDAFLLAALGARVTLIERCPKVHALLLDGMMRAKAEDPDVAAVMARMTLIHGDARQVLPGLRADVVVLDPMHPPRRGFVLVKQQMRALRELVGADSDAAEMMEAAFGAARHRVVLKWPRYAAPLAGLPKPSHQILGKTVRYDVFMMPMAD